MIAALLATLASAQPMPLDWDFQGRAVPGTVEVLPALLVNPEVDHAQTTWVGAGLVPQRAALRRRQQRRLRQLPDAIASALPGAINARVGADWGGHFTPAGLPLGARRRLRHALGSGGLGDALADLGVDDDHAGSLLVWVSQLRAEPLSASTFAGDIVRTEDGPVVVDHEVEPYRVIATVGVALVAADGELVVRYVDHFDAALTDTGPADTGRRIAHLMAEQLATVWPSDARLRDELVYAER